MWGAGLTLLGTIASAIIGSAMQKRPEIPEPPEIEDPGVKFQDPGKSKKKLSGVTPLPGLGVGGWGSAGGYTPDYHFGQSRIAGAKSLQKKLYGQ